MDGMTDLGRIHATLSAAWSSPDFYRGERSRALSYSVASGSYPAVGQITNANALIGLEGNLILATIHVIFVQFLSLSSHLSLLFHSDFNLPAVMWT